MVRLKGVTVGYGVVVVTQRKAIWEFGTSELQTEQMTLGLANQVIGSSVER